MKVNKIDIVSALLINVLVVMLYKVFLYSYFSATGIISVYIIALIVSLYIYALRSKEYIVDASLGIICIISMIYIVMIKKNWPLFAMEICVVVLVFSISSFFFDWKKLDRR